MANDDIWILGINMTKFGKHTDRDVVDLASEAVMAALADGGRVLLPHMHRLMHQQAGDLYRSSSIRAAQAHDACDATLTGECVHRRVCVLPDDPCRWVHLDLAASLRKLGLAQAKSKIRSWRRDAAIKPTHAHSTPSRAYCTMDSACARHQASCRCAWPPASQWRCRAAWSTYCHREPGRFAARPLNRAA